MRDLQRQTDEEKSGERKVSRFWGMRLISSIIMTFHLCRLFTREYVLHVDEVKLIMLQVVVDKRLRCKGNPSQSPSLKYLQLYVHRPVTIPHLCGAWAVFNDWFNTSFAVNNIHVSDENCFLNDNLKRKLMILF